MSYTLDARTLAGSRLETIESAITNGKGGLYLNIHAQPGARKPQLRGMHGDALKIAVREAAQDGKANDAIIRFLAAAMDIPRTSIQVATGHTSRRKRVFISGIPDRLKHQLQQLLNHT